MLYLTPPANISLVTVAGPAAIFLGMTALAGCASSLLENSAARTEQSITMSCRAWEERAKKAAYPDRETIARHDQLLAKAAAFFAEAQAQYRNMPARETAIGNEAQAKIEADAIYDWRHDLKVAADCWDGLKDIQPLSHQRYQLAESQKQRLAQLAEELAAQQRQFLLSTGR